MHLLGKSNLSTLQKQDKVLDKWLSAWISEISHAQWRCSDDVFEQFPKVKGQDNNSFLFFVTEQKKYCIEVQIAFPQGIVLIIASTEIIDNDNR